MTTQSSRLHAQTSVESADDDVPVKSNIALHLLRMSGVVPEQPAIIATRSYDRSHRAVYASLTFAELEALSNRYANGLVAAGIRRGARTMVMVRPGVEFMGLVFALFKIGAVPVMIDPGMGIRRMLECIRTVDLEAFVGIPPAHAMRVLRPAPFKTVEHVVTVGRRWFWGGPTLDTLARSASPSFAATEIAPDEPAAILFTSGSTGPAKGVLYEHGMFGAQVHQIQRLYGIEAGEVDVPTFPLFGLFSIAMGMTAVIPDMDPTRPARVDPAKIVQTIHDHHATNTFGSPALWKRVAAHCVANRIKLPSLRRILIAGAPVPYPVIEQLHQVLNPEADVHTPYGATEALPIASIAGREVLGHCRDFTRRGAGTCVGTVLPEIDVRIIRITDEAATQWSDDLVLPQGEIGEIVVAGPVVTKEYYGLTSATSLAKIRDADRIRHRMGDVGYRDEQGRLWFCGRKAHRVLTEDGPMFTIPCEAVFNEHPDVARSALVGIGPAGVQLPVIIVEPIAGKFPSGARAAYFREELRELGRANDLTRGIDRVLFHRSLPVDVRHNVKINRELLAAWAARQSP